MSPKARTSVSQAASIVLAASLVTAPVASADPVGPTPVDLDPQPIVEFQDGELVMERASGERIYMPGSEIYFSRNGEEVKLVADDQGAFALPKGLDDVQSVTFSGLGNFEEVTYTIDLGKKTFAKDMTTGQVVGTIIGAVLGAVGLLGSAVQLSGVAKFNTDVQKRLGIYNPQRANQVEQALPAISGALGVAGLGLAIGMAVPKEGDEISVKVGDETFKFKGLAFPPSK